MIQLIIIPYPLFSSTFKFYLNQSDYKMQINFESDLLTFMQDDNLKNNIILILVQVILVMIGKTIRRKVEI